MIFFLLPLLCVPPPSLLLSHSSCPSPSFFLSLVSPMSHDWPSTRTKYLTEENCLPTTASVSLASFTDSSVLALELFKKLLRAELLVGSPPARCCFPLISPHLKDGCVHIYPSENLLLCKYLQLRPSWEGTHDTGTHAFLFLQNIHKIGWQFPRVCFLVLCKQLLLQKAKGIFKTGEKKCPDSLRELQNSKLLIFQGKHLVALQI